MPTGLQSRQEMMKVALTWLMALTAVIILPAVKADYEDGLDAALRGDYQTAFREFSIAAEAGLDVAQYNLAILYYMGQGVERNLELAFQWTTAAAEQGHLGAQANLGSLYLDGSGTAKDIDTGVAWLATAARGGHADSAMILARMHVDSDLVSQNLVQAHAWASMAHKHEHPDAESFRAEIESRLSPDQISAARLSFTRWQIEPAELPGSTRC